jgi:hypothetical protein
MEAFWKWLMRANARAVLAGALVVLIATVAWWLWREWRPERSASMLPHLRERTSSNSNLTELAFLDRRIAEGPGCPDGNPFLFYRRRLPPGSPDPLTHVRPRAPRVDGRPDPQRPAPPPPPQRPRERDRQPDPPQRDTVILTYKGIFKRSDGSVVALVNDSKTEQGAFYKTGARLHWVRIGDFDTRQAEIVLPDGTVTRIKLGEPETFEEE